MSRGQGSYEDDGLGAAWQELAAQAAQQAVEDKPWLLAMLNQCGADLVARYALWKQRLGRMRQGERRRLQRRLGVSLAGAALLLAASPGMGAPGAAMTVTNGTSTVANGDGCSLPEAIANANSDNQSGSTDCTGGSGADTITISVPVGLTAALPAISTTVTIEGGGNTISRSSGSFRILHVSSGGNLTLNSATISGGIATAGGGIDASAALLTITNSTLSGNSSSAAGGGIWAISSTLTVTNSTISGNASTSSGGGVFAVSSSVAISNSTLSGNSTTQGSSRGAGIAAYSTTLAVSRSTISGNRHAGASGFGGGIYVGDPGGVARLTLTNSTLSGNSAALGGALATYKAATTVANSTLTNNSASPTGLGFGGGIWRYAGAVTVSNSIVAAQISGNDCNAIPPTSGGHNIESGTSCGFAGTGDQQSTNPLLAALANNGGPTLTHLPQKNSPALDKGSCSAGTDQRSLTRPVDLSDTFYPNGVGGSCDVGAVEVQSITANAVSLQDFTALRGAGGVVGALWAGLLAAGLGLAVGWRRRGKKPDGEGPASISLVMAEDGAGQTQAAASATPGTLYQPPAIVQRSRLKHFTGSPLAVEPLDPFALPD